MEIDAKLRAALEPAWSELREQRLLGRVAEARRQHGRRRRRFALLATSGALAAGAAAAVVVLAPRMPMMIPMIRPLRRETAAIEATPAREHQSRITFADGSQAILTSDGNVQIEEQTLTRVRLRQRWGAARYLVQHNPAREFVVAAEGVVVRVRGTIFSVKIAPPAVEVSVERGRVEIADGFRTRDLVAGEALSVPVGRAAGDGAGGAGPNEDPNEIDGAQEGAPEGAAGAREAEAVVGDQAASAAAPAAPGAAAENTSLTGRRRAAAPLSASALLARADDARATGRSAEAARALTAFIASYPHERRRPAALFTLGRVERARGRPEAAADAFEQCAAARPDGPLADDALAEAAQAWSAAGTARRARADARAYLGAHPGGIHAAAMRALGAR